MDDKNKGHDNTTVRALVQTTELQLREIREYLEGLESALRECEDPGERADMIRLLQEQRLKFSLMVTSVTIFKAKNGIFTNLKRLE